MTIKVEFSRNIKNVTVIFFLKKTLIFLTRKQIELALNLHGFHSKVMFGVSSCSVI